MSQVIEPAAFPSVMREKLSSVRWRKVAVSSLRAILLAAAALMAAMIVAMTIDWILTPFDTATRHWLTGISLALAVATLLYVAWRPLVDAIRWSTAASAVDREIPQLQERWTTVASFTAANQTPQSSMAEAMAQQVTSEAIAMGRLVSAKRVVTTEVLKRPLAIVSLVACALLAFMLLNWPQTTVLWQRFWSPSTDITATRLSVINPPDIVPRGSVVEIKTRLSGMSRQDATLTLVSKSRPTEELSLQPSAEEPALFVCLMDVDDSFSYRIQAGDGRTAWHSVTAIDFPVFSEVRLTVTPPEYVNDRVVQKTLIPGRLRAIQGSYLKLSLKPDMPLKKLDLLVSFPEGAIDAARGTSADLPDASGKMELRKLRLEASPDGWYHFESQLNENFSFSPMMVNRHDLEDENRRTCRVEVIVDKAPVARVITPNFNGPVNPDDLIDIKFEAHDDHGIATAELVIYDETDPQGDADPKVLAVVPIPLGDQQSRKHVLGQTQLNLKSLGLDDDRDISYAVRVTDNRRLKHDAHDVRHRLNGRSKAEPESPMSDMPPIAESVATASHNGAQEQAVQSPSKSDADHLRTREPGQDLASSSKRSQKDSTSPDGYKEMLANAGPQIAQSPDRQVEKQEMADATNENQLASPNDPESKNRSAESKRQPPGPSSQSNKPASETAMAQNDFDRQTSSPQKTSEQKVVTARAAGDGKRKTDSEDRKADRKQKPERSRQRAKNASLPVRVAGGQKSDVGQKRETDRRRLKISKQLAALAARNNKQRTGASPARDKVVEVRKRLQEVEAELTALFRHEVETSARIDSFRRLDGQLGDTEIVISDLHTETQNTKFEFAGLQMVEIGSSHVTPARDGVFLAIRTPDSGSDALTEESLHHVISAVELLDALLARYDRVQREIDLAEKLDKAIEIYTVVVEGEQRLLREAQDNRDPLKLKRTMAVVEVDQPYLDRLADVRRKRRDMMTELGKILSDDPRLRAKYLDLIKRNRSSLRSQLAELFDRQDLITQEVNGWTQIADTQRENYWLQLSDLRMDAPQQLAKDVQAFVERVEKQMPLILDSTQGTPALVIELARKLAADVRRCDLDVREIRKSGGDAATVEDLSLNANELVFGFAELTAALEQLGFENEDREGLDDYIALRLAENRQLADVADVWAEVAEFITAKTFSGLAQVDQQQIAIGTEVLRLDMQDIETELAGQFQGEPVPQQLANIARDLLRVMERITFNQAAASFALSHSDVNTAAIQQNLALDGFEEAERMFDRLRRESILELDKIEVNDPDIAALRDPTLDQFLAQLEREPNIEARLGIPRRPRNIRTLRENLLWSEGKGMLGQSRDAAARRAENERQRRRQKQADANSRNRQQKEQRNMTEEEKQELAEAKDMQEMLKARMQKAVEELEEKAEDQSASKEQRQTMRRMAERMKKSLKQVEPGDVNGDVWDKLVESEQAQHFAELLAAGESLPDEQWNKLMSTLDDGLWQVGTRTPPEDYRKPIEQYQDRVRELTGAGVE